MKRTSGFSSLTATNETNETGKSINLFGDYAFTIDGEIRYGRVHHMRKKGKKQGYVEYNKPVSFDDDLKDISIIFNVYNFNEDGKICKRSSSDNHQAVPARNVISSVNLNYSDENNCFYGDEEELKCIENEFCEKKKTKKQTRLVAGSIPFDMGVKETLWEKDTLKELEL